MTILNTRSMPRPRGRTRYTALLLAMCGLSALVSSAVAQSPENPMARAPRDWIVDTAVNEIQMLNRSDVYLRYRMHMVDQKGDQTRDVIESKDGSVARLILRDGRALTPDEDKGERQRLADMVASPEAYARHVKNDATSRKLAIDLIRMMPDAMIYTYVPGQPQTPHWAEQQVVMDYHPNPKWSPPTTTSQALTGLEGRIWIDVKSHRMVRMEGHIFKAVNFGWGLLAHIYPGGNLSLEQTDVGRGRWIYTHFVENVTVRAVMVKTLSIHSTIDASGFQILPGPLTYQEAIQQLLATPLPSS